MVRLTEEMVVARSRISDLTAVKKLNCWGSELTDVSILRELKKVEVLSLSVNNISSLADFQYCLNLKDLFVRKNNITDLNEICYLQNLPNLRNLWLGENPCAEREGYRMAVIRALPSLEKLDDKFVTAEELNTALSRGKILIHPLEMDASPPQSAPASPEEAAEFIEERVPEANRRYSSSSDQRSYDETHGHEEYTDRRNANYNASPPNQYSQNNPYNYETQNGQMKAPTRDEGVRMDSRNGENLPINTIELGKDYDERPAISRHNGDNDDRRYEYSLHQEAASRANQGLTSPRSSYPTVEYVDESTTSSYHYDEDFNSPHPLAPSQPPAARRQYSSHQNLDREESREMPGGTEMRFSPQNLGKLHARSPSPQFSDSLDTLIPFESGCDIQRSSSGIFGGLGGGVKGRGGKNVSIDPSPRYFGDEGPLARRTDGLKGTPRVAGGGGRRKELSLSENWGDFEGREVRRVNSEDCLPVREGAKEMRYIQSGKGSWSYNL